MLFLSYQSWLGQNVLEVFFHYDTKLMGYSNVIAVVTNSHAF